MTFERLSEVRDDHGVLTHKMCCICFDTVPVDELWRDENNDRWDLCSPRCAADAGMIPHPQEEGS